MEFVFLTSDFYTDHPAERFPELEHKQDRPYVLVLITVGANRFAIRCVPISRILMRI